jgi:hypothetical protein
VAVGTKFAVRLETDQVRVLVSEGRVRIEKQEDDHKVTLAQIASGSIGYTRGGEGVLTQAQSAERVEEALSWRTGFVVFPDTPLIEAVQELNRYNTRRIVIEDPRIATMRISGNFRAANGDAFARLPVLLSLVLAATACVRDAQARSASFPRDSVVTAGRPRVTIQSPTTVEVLQGVTIIRFRAEHVTIASPFAGTEVSRGPLPTAHLHVTVDGTAWHWMHTTLDPVVVTPLPAGEHTVALELAGSDHRPLDVQTVRFTVAARTAPGTAHGSHR